MSRGIHLGPFELLHPIARGGMGEVWRGLHAGEQLPVAVKVLTRAHAGIVDALRHEVRAVAGLRHPHIVWIYDQGIITEAAAQASDGRLVSGTPWFAMELCEGGTLARRGAHLTWPELRAVLLSLLDALAHAHARGVVHRDIKPANVLFGTGRAGLKLSDFGMVYEVGDTPRPGEEPLSGGTPSYMSPEQIRSDWALQGPATDLYAVGCMAWRLVCGHSPYRGEHVFAVVRGHLIDPVPALKPRFSVPPGLEAWIRRLMAKAPHDRFLWAADAAASLMALDPARGGASGGMSIDPQVPTLIREALGTTLFLPSDLDLPAQEPGCEGVEHPAPPIPDDWRRPSEPEPPAHLLGAGIGLYGVRAVPLVDRDEARDALWADLLTMRREGRPRAVVLRGASGHGKSALAHWLLRRAHELGAARTLRAGHSPQGVPGEGVAGLLARHLRCLGVGGPALVAHLERSPDLPAELVDAVAEVLAPGSTGGRLRLESVTERHAAEASVLRALAAVRPLVLWLDDVQWGIDAVAFAHGVLVRAELPVLFVLTVREEALPERRAASSVIDALLRRDAAREQIVGPLPVEFRPELVRRLLRLEPELAEAVEERAAGNPMFAVQLLGAWVAAGALVSGPRGYRLAGDDALPASIGDVWAARVGRLLEDREPWQVPLEIAAVLGQEVDLGEWREACGLAGVEAPAGLLDALLAGRLAELDANAAHRFAFVHGMLRASIVQRAVRGGRAQTVHRCCAAMLAGRDHATAPERQGHHLVAAGAHAAAIAPLTRAAAWRLRTSDYALAERQLALREAALEACGAPSHDRRWAQGWLLWSAVSSARERDEACDHYAERALAAAEAHGWGELEVQALSKLSHSARATGRIQEALQLGERAARTAEPLGDAATLAGANRAYAAALGHLGDLARAAELLRAAALAYERAGDGSRAMVTWFSACANALQRLAPDELPVMIARGRALATEVGSRHGLAEADFLEAVRLEICGEVDASLSLLRSTLVAFEAIGHARARLVRANLGLGLASAGRFAEAEALLRACVRPEVRGWLQAGVQLGLALCVAADDSDDRWRLHLDRALELDVLEQVDVSYAQVAEQAAQRALEVGRAARAREAAELAAQAWRKLGQPDRAEAALRRME